MQNLYKSDIEDLKENVENTIKDLNLDEKKKELEELKEKSLNQDFWKDADVAKKTLTKVDALKKEIESADKLLKDCNDFLELFELADENEKASLVQDFEKLQQEFEKFTKYKFLSGKYDKTGAILSIHAGQGGTEAQDWAEMLLRMYTRYCERQGWKCEILHSVPGTEAGISSVSIEIDGPYAYGYLKRETGTHRLVRLSPFNAQNLRQTSFAGVEVIPLIEEDAEIEVNEKDIEFKAVRSGGPGGQSVNKTSSAVIITHKPTGITIQCSEGRDQLQNKKKAMQILKSKLWTLEEEKREKNLQNLKGEHKIAGWGNQIRNYILHPYKLVKDLRTNMEYSNPEEVLDGNLDIFLEALLRI
jgi:peptide chain release factor 2